MADIVDIANDLVSVQASDAFKAIASLVPQEKHELDEDDEVLCDDCGCEIPYARARLGHARCISCQEFYERDSRRYKRGRRDDYEYE